MNFVMDHEHYTYPEALRYIADKYNIEIEEEEQTPEQLQMLNEQDSLYNLNTFAQKYFSDNLIKTEEGKAVGLSYLKEREYREDTINKFQLGYCIDDWADFTNHARKHGYKSEYLEKTGLTINKEDKQYDRFRGRVMFPIHNLTGKVIGFGGRILSSEKSKAKYVNSPESDIYYKSKSLYGIYFARNAIVRQDQCYLVEGYTDVISLNQAGIENVVASSGTSLTSDQVKLIKRYTPNITILYDGDEAGLKASFRGIDMILEQGMNVKIVLFPEGEDPDSYVRSHRTAEVEEFITKQSGDFISFKTRLLYNETKDDPLKKASLVKEIVKTIALVPDGIYRSMFVKECGNIMDVPEQTLMNELNRLLRKRFADKMRVQSDVEIPEPTEFPAEKQIVVENQNFEYQEKEIIRLLLNYGDEEMFFEEEEKGRYKKRVPVKVANFIVNDLLRDDICLKNNAYQQIIHEYEESFENDHLPDNNHFINHKDDGIREIVINLLSSPYMLSENWIKKRIVVPSEKDRLKQLVTSSLLSYKAKHVDNLITENQKAIKESENDEDRHILLQKHVNLKKMSSEINRQLSRIITK